MQYLFERRKALGGFVPSRTMRAQPIETPALGDYAEFLKDAGDRAFSTTQSFVRFFTKLVGDKKVGKLLVPIVPDESRTFGMDPLFRKIGIYSHAGQLYQPVDSEELSYYREAKDGQLLEEGITEAGSMASFIAAGTAHSAHGVNMMPFYIYYSMFGFQRIGDMVWCAADARTKGFMLGATAGRTTLGGEGLQHQDGHSHLLSSSFPTVRSYDPAYQYEIAVIILDGMRRMYQEQEDCMYYITLQNEAYRHPAMLEGIERGIVKGMYKLHHKSAGEGRPQVQLLGSGALLREAIRAQEILAEKYQVSSNVWSVTSYTELSREAQSVERWNLLHPLEAQRQSYLSEVLTGEEGPFISTSDNVRAVAKQIDAYVPGGLYALGTDGLGRSENRAPLRRHFEVDAECVVVASLAQLVERGQFDRQQLAQAIQDLGIDPEKADPLTA